MRGFRFLFEDGKLPLKTMTGDRGKEFACYQEVEKTLGVPSISLVPIPLGRSLR